jgi:hypothetical protein
MYILAGTAQNNHEEHEGHEERTKAYHHGTTGTTDGTIQYLRRRTTH